MKIRHATKTMLAAAIGLAFTFISAHAQLISVNLREQGTFGPFVGGTNNNVTNNGAFNTTETVTTGTPVATPFTIVYNPLTGPSTIPLGTGTLDTANLMFSSPVNPQSFFSSTSAIFNYDFDNNGSIDLSQTYTINLSPFTSPNGLTGVSYSIIPQQFFGSVLINGQNYGYASVVANNSGVLFDGSSTTSTVQFQFVATPVPEPSTYAVAGILALVGVVCLRRRSPQDRIALAV